MFLDNEIDAINYIILGIDHYNVLQYDGNSFNKKISGALKISINSQKTMGMMSCHQIFIQTNLIVCLMWCE